MNVCIGAEVDNDIFHIYWWWFEIVVIVSKFVHIQAQSKRYHLATKWNETEKKIKTKPKRERKSPTVNRTIGLSVEKEWESIHQRQWQQQHYRIDEFIRVCEHNTNNRHIEIKSKRKKNLNNNQNDGLRLHPAINSLSSLSPTSIVSIQAISDS